ncbi:SDR family oxidoreductase [uncultured Sphingomonas sp.]|uniref:SDR family NAD(P)-dependent oxidoreductase n=1 Tax=uncultured Sphingomonas sp. TaxID=158754 RepID=UPI0025F863F1|nr:SDR family oxidoreductase [uncultured Sphingomonas sp.]
MDYGLGGALALVTGADGGIGREVARMLLQEGAKVAISDRDAKSLEQVRAELAEYGDVVAIAADVTDLSSVKALFEQLRGERGDPTILVHTAGVTGATGDFLEVDDAGWQSTLDINLMGAVRVTREAIPAMRKGGGGRIVLIASEDAVQPYVDELAYCASKAGVLNLAKGLSKAYGCDNVLVNSVSPAFIATPMTDAMMDKRAEEQGTDRDSAIRSFLKEERPGMTLGRRGRAEEVAAAILFLVSKPASFVNGANLRVDSGSVMTMAG